MTFDQQPNFFIRKIVLIDFTMRFFCYLCDLGEIFLGIFRAIALYIESLYQIRGTVVSEMNDGIWWYGDLEKLSRQLHC